jgi:hypothetical protein
MYSPRLRHLNLSPLNFFKLEKMTVLAGIFNPIANVSVAKSTFNQPDANIISIISLIIGIKPP